MIVETKLILGVQGFMLREGVDSYQTATPPPGGGCGDLSGKIVRLEKALHGLRLSGSGKA